MMGGFEMKLLGMELEIKFENLSWMSWMVCGVWWMSSWESLKVPFWQVTMLFLITGSILSLTTLKFSYKFLKPPPADSEIDSKSPKSI